MRNFTKIFFALTLIFLSYGIRSYSQNVTVSGAITGDGSYADLSAAFTAVNSGVQTGANISILITGNTTEPVTGAELNSGAWTSINIQPSGGAARTISGAVNAGIPLIDLNGADNVTIDGLNSGGNSLTISNTTVSSTAGTSSIRMQSDAVNNLITNCTILGSSITPVGNNGGTVWIGASSSTTGNDNNTISYCDIGPAGGNFPSKAVFISGTSNAKANNGDTIRNCNIYDYFNLTNTSSGIYIEGGTSDITLKDNKFYQTIPKVLSSGNYLHTAISILNTSGNNFQILNNVIGYSSSSGTGIYSISGASVQFRAINLSTGSSVATSIQGNIINSINHSTANAGTGNSSPCTMIYINNGLTEIGNISGNNIGSMTANGNIVFSNSPNGAADFNAIAKFGTSNWNCSNNNIGGITVSNSTTGAIDLSSIRDQTSANLIFTCTNNSIGGDPVNSISNLSTANGSSVKGIIIEDAIGIITGNIIRNMTGAGGTQTGVNASVLGIGVNTSGSSGIDVSQNIIHSLKNSNISTATIVSGIYVNCQDGTNLISRNFIHSLTINNSSAEMNGIEASSGTSVYQNNMLRLGIDPDGNSINEGATLRGIYEFNGGNYYYFNSIFLGGAATGGSGNSYAVYSNITTGIRVFKNNIFYNARSNSGSTGIHYGIRYGGNTYNQPGLTSNYNNVFVNGTGGAFGSFNNNDISDIGSWQTTVGSDYLSFSSDPKFILPEGNLLNLDLHINSSAPTEIEGNGNDIISVTEDFDGQTRNTLTPVDIGADAGYFTGVLLDYKVILAGANFYNNNYPTLAAAFSAINSNDQTGANIEVRITDNLSEPPSGTVLYEGNWQSLIIKPDGGSPRTVSGTLNPGSPLIYLNGADNVKIDGLNTGGNSLTLENPLVSSVSGTNAICIQNDATSNLITNCTILGSSTINFNTVLGGVLSFGTSNGMLTGNDNNVVSYCNVGPANGNLPSKCIDFKGSTSAALSNNNDTVRNCNIYDYFNTSIQSTGLNISEGNRDIAILNNRFYQTSQRIDSLGVTHSGIWIENTSAQTNINFTVSGNVIGFSNNSGTGTYSLIGSNNFKFRGIFIGANEIQGESNLQGNTISGIKMEGTFRQSDGNAPFIGILISNGIVNTGNITGNQIGSITGNDSIIYKTNTNLSGELIGIFNNSASDWNCSNNKFGTIYAENSGSSSIKVRCIYSNMNADNIFHCENNTVGGSDSNSISSYSNSLDSRIDGILNEHSISDIQNNLIRNLTLNGGNSGNSFNFLSGIFINSNSHDHYIYSNKIHTLKNYAVSDPTINGIFIRSDPGENTVSSNLIQGLISGNETSKIYGIRSDGGSTTFKNNIIQLGLDQNGSSMYYGSEIRGIYESGGNSNFYFNSVYIGGDVIYGSNNSFAFYSNITTDPREYRNNIFYNARSNSGGIGINYSVRLGGSVPNPIGLTCNNNVYLATGNGSVLGLYNDTNIFNLGDWQSRVGQDANSFNQDPHFIQPDGSVNTLDLHIDPSFPTVINANGFDIPSVTMDYDGDIRSGLTPVDIGADAGDFPLYYADDIKTESAVIENQVFLIGNSYDLKVNIRNFGTNPQSSVPVYYSVNGGAAVGPVFSTGSIPQLGTQIINFTDTNSFIPVVSGLNVFKVYSAYSSDENRYNDTIKYEINVQLNVASLPFIETFSNLSNWSVAVENPVGSTKLWELGLCTNPVDYNSNIAATSNCYLGSNERIEILRSPVIDFSTINNNSGGNFPVLSFYASYTGYPGLDDSLEVLVSTDNGISFFTAATVYNKSQMSSPSLATRPVQYTEYFPDSSLQWRHELINLNNVVLDTNVIIGFRSKSDLGNRLWIDNIIVSEASSFNSQPVNSPGIFNFGNLSINMNTIASRPVKPEILNSDRHTGISKSPPEKEKIVGEFPVSSGAVNITTEENFDLLTDDELSVIKYPFEEPVPSVAETNVKENNPLSGATTGDGSKFTPNFVNPEIYFTAGYSGNDQLGYAEYDLKIDVAGISNLSDINKAYILKRADITAPWECVNTTVSGDTLIASGLNNFSDFSIGSFENLAVTVNLIMFIEGFYQSGSDSQVSDIIKTYLRSSSTPYDLIDSTSSVVSASGNASLKFYNAPNGNYLLVLTHRNSIETWSSSALSLSEGGFTGYDISNSVLQAYGSNMIQVDASPVRFAFYSGDVNQDGTVDLTDGSLIDNDAFNFASGYVPADVNGDDIVDLADAVFADNNAFNFVSKITP